MSANHDDADFKKAWRLGWLSSIQEYSDYGLQESSWLGGLEPNNPHWSYAEFLCSYFHGCGVEDGYADYVRDGIITASEAQAIAQFHAAADSYQPPRGDVYDHAAILADPRWHQVVSFALAARKELLGLLTDSDEVAALAGP